MNLLGVMKKLKFSTDSFITTLFATFILSIVLLRTEIFTDNSIATASPFLTISLLVSILFSFMWYFFIIKYSPFICLLNLMYLVSASVLAVQASTRVKYFTISDPKVVEDGLFYKDLMDKDFINVFLYSKDIHELEDRPPNLKEDTLVKLKTRLIKKVLKACSVRKISDEIVIVKEDFTNLKVETCKDAELFIKMLNSIYFSKFPPNLVLILRVFDIENLKRNGFNRPMTNLNSISDLYKGDDESGAKEIYNKSEEFTIEVEEVTIEIDRKDFQNEIGENSLDQPNNALLPESNEDLLNQPDTVLNQETNVIQPIQTDEEVPQTEYNETVTNLTKFFQSKLKTKNNDDSAFQNDDGLFFKTTDQIGSLNNKDRVDDEGNYSFIDSEEISEDDFRKGLEDNKGFNRTSTPIEGDIQGINDSKARCSSSINDLNYEFASEADPAILHLDNFDKGIGNVDEVHSSVGNDRRLSGTDAEIITEMDCK